MPIQIFKEVRTSFDFELIQKVYNAALKHFDLEDVFDIDLTFVSERTIQQYNKETRNIDRVTDILSYPTLDFKFPFVKSDYEYDINPETNNIMLGDLILCQKRAREQAKEYGHSIEREVGFLVLHGILHLLGFDHIKKDDEVVMQSHAKEILESIGLNRN